jgi:predicted DNA-binding protein (MmcQ/YjbR family)
MRSVCLALPGASEGVHYGEIVFQVGRKMFASCGAKHGPRTIVFRVGPERTEALLAAGRGFRRYAYEKTALEVAASEVADWEELRELVRESFRRETREAAGSATSVRRRRSRSDRRGGPALPEGPSCSSA